MNILTLLSNMICLLLHVTDAESFPKPLSKKEEADAIEKMMHGSKEAKTLLIERNLRLVAHIVKKYYTQNDNQEDLISIGTIGLIKGINSFNPQKSTRLATYCARCIENEILMHFRGSKKQNGEISFDEPIEVDGEGNPLTLMDIIAVDDTIVDEIDTNNKLKRLVKIIHNMPEGREKQIIVNRYGLNGRPPLTQREVAKKLNISRSYVSRIEKRLLQEFKELL